jgi:hypothetical protein
MVAFGRVEPGWSSGSEPEICHAQVLRDELFERAVKDDLWPGVPVRGLHRQLTLVGQVHALNVSFLARPRTHTGDPN